MFTVRPICVQDSISKMSSESPAYQYHHFLIVFHVFPMERTGAPLPAPGVTETPSFESCTRGRQLVSIQIETLPENMINTLRLRQDGRYLADNIFKCIFLNENVWISNKISLTFVPEVPIYHKPSLIQIMAWRLTGDKPLSESMMAYFTDAYKRHSASMS